MRFAYLLVLLGFYYVSLGFDMYSGVIGDHGKWEQKRPRAHCGRVTRNRLSHLRCGKNDIFPTYYI
jgi:hypothetical protein